MWRVGYVVTITLLKMCIIDEISLRTVGAFINFIKMGKTSLLT